MGVPESESGSGDFGFRQVWRILTIEGLMSVGSDGRVQPRIAESWQVSEDSLTWRLTLRSNVFFHDGTPVDAAAVRQILDAAIKRPQVSALYPGILDVRAITTEDPHVLVIQLRRPSAFLLDNLDIPLTKTSADGTESGTGPYYLVSNLNTEAKLRAHERYHLGAPQIREITFRSYPTLRQAWASLLRGEIDVLSNVSGDALEFATDDSIEVFSYPRHYAHVMVFNSQRPQLRAAGVRRALNVAVDRRAIIQAALKGRGRPADSPVWPDHWAYDPAVGGYSYDPALAKTTLSAIARQVRSSANGSSRMQLTCILPEGHAVTERLALLVQRQLYDVGVDLQLESLPMLQVDARLRSGNFDAVLFDMISAPTISRVYQFWRSPGEFRGLNVFGYRNAEADKWLDRLRFAADDASVRAATSQLQRVVMEDPPALFLAWSERSRIVSRRIEIPGGRDRDPFVNVWQWRIRNERELTEE